MENEAKMEEKGILDEEETIGVVFKDDLSYTLRFQVGRAVFPNEGLEHVGNEINGIQVLICH